MFTNSVDTLMETLKGVKRYLEISNGKGSDNCISEIKCDGNVFTITFHGHCGETFDLIFWNGNDGQLHIENGREFNGVKEEVYDYADEEEWTEEDINYIKFGR